MQRTKNAVRIRRKKSSFIKIWIRAAVPVLAASAAALLFLLHVMLIFLTERQRSIASEIAYEQTYIIKEADLSSFEEVSKKLYMNSWQMVAALYDGQGKLLGESEIGKYDFWKIPKEKYEEVLSRLKEIKFAEQRKIPGFDEVDLFGDNCLYGREVFTVGRQTFTLRFAKIINPWRQHKDSFLMTGFLVIVGMAGLTLVIAGQYYGIYKERVKAEEYYRNTSNALAHDLKTPLMAISGYAEMLHENVHAEKKNYYSESILKNVMDMNSIIENMLELSKLENPKIILNKEMIDLYSLTMEVLKKFQMEIQAGELKTEVQGRTDVFADRILMKRAVENLVSNAVKYTPKNHKIFISMEKGAWQIKNTGSRIEDAYLAHIWEPFVKGEEARGNVAGTGTGQADNLLILHSHGKISIINILGIQNGNGQEKGVS